MVQERIEEAARHIAEASRLLSEARELAGQNTAEDSGALSTIEIPTPPKPKDLLQATYDLLNLVREASAEEREVFEKRGFVFLPIEAKSLVQVCAENEEYLGYVNPSENLRTYTPPQAFEVAVNPARLRLPRSNNSSQSRQLRMIDQYSHKEIETVVPDAKAIMLPATADVQLDIQFQKRNNGEKLFGDFWVRALDKTADFDVASVGRSRPVDQLYVYGWDADIGGPDIWAVPAVVFLRK